MLYYAVYDLVSGHVLHTHSRVDVKGQYQEVPEAHVLSLLNPGVDRATVGITAVEMPKDMAARGGLYYRIDPKTRKPIFGSRGGGGNFGP